MAIDEQNISIYVDQCIHTFHPLFHWAAADTGLMKALDPDWNEGLFDITEAQYDMDTEQ